MAYSIDQEKLFYRQGPRGDLPLTERTKYLCSMVDDLSFLEGMAVLEIGAGLGQYTKLFKSKYGVSLAVASDLMSDQLTLGKKRYGQLSGVAADCFHLPFKAGSFDMVFGSLILHRFRGKELEDVIAQIRRVLKPRGRYLGIEPSLRNPAHVLRHIVSEHSGNEYLMSSGLLKNSFANHSFAVDLKLMAPRHPWVRNFGLATCLGILARKDG